MRWLLLVLLAMLVLGIIIFASSAEFDAASSPMLGHRANSIAAGLAGIVVFFVLVVGTGIYLSR
jgi:hypothetical protein